MSLNKSNDLEAGDVALQAVAPARAGSPQPPRGTPNINGLGTGPQQHLSSQSQSPARPPSRSSTSSTSGTTADKPPTRSRRAADSALALAKDQWFILALAATVVVASQVQVPLAHQHTKETVVTYLCIAVIYFITGCTLPTRVLIDNYARWRLHLFVQAQCYLLTSAMTFGLVAAAASNRDFMDPWLLLGFIFLGCVPTTISSNVVMTREAHGNASLTLVESTIGNVLAPFLVPPLFSMYTSTGAWYTRVLPQETGGYGQVYKRVFQQLGLSLFVPLAVGQVVQHLWPAAAHKVFVTWRVRKVASLCLLVVVWQTFDSGFAYGAFQTAKTSNMVFVVFISVALFAAWLAVCLALSVPWLPVRDSVSVAYLVPAKTMALGVPISTVFFTGIRGADLARMQMPLVIFQGFQLVFGSLLMIPMRAWVARAARGEKQAGGSEAGSDSGSHSTGSADRASGEHGTVQEAAAGIHHGANGGKGLSPPAK